MTKKIMKRSLALGALMAFAITGSAMAASYAEGNGNAITVTSATGKDRVVGGLGKDATDYSAKINGDVTVNSGHWDMAIGGHYAGGSAVDTDINVISTNVVVNGGEVEQLVGGTGFSDGNGIASDSGRTTNIVINDGSFGLEVDNTNCPELLVMGGDLAKSGQNDAEIESSIESTSVKIEDGTFNAAVIGGSSAIRYYAGYESGELDAHVGNTKINITGGTFNDAIAGGGLAWGHHTNSSVDNAEINISGKDGNLIVNGDIYAGGLDGSLGAGYETAVSTVVNKADIKIDNATVKNVYGFGGNIASVDNGGGKYDWSYNPNSDKDAIVNTSLKFINSTADKIDIQKGDIEFRVEGAEGEVKVNELVTGDDVGVVCTADGDANDALGGDEKEIHSKITVGGNNITNTSFTVEEGEVAGKLTFDVDENGKIINLHREANVTNQNVSSIASMGLVSWRDQMDDMNKRLGELRDSNGEHGVWVRMVRGESEYQGAEYQANTYQVGYDEKLSTDPSWTVGVAFTYTDGDSNGNKVSGENKQKGLNIYGSKLNDDGSYIDLVAKYARIENDFETANKLREGEYDTNGYSISAEYGKRFAQASGLWVEPQVQLTYGYVDSVDYKFGKADVAQDDFTSLVGRVGFRVGKDIAKGNVYAKASYLYDFDGETEMTMSRGQASETYKQDLGGSWYEVGVGTNINLSEATHLYLDAEKSFGGDVDTDWKWNVGVRYSF